MHAGRQLRWRLVFEVHISRPRIKAVVWAELLEAVCIRSRSADFCVNQPKYTGCSYTATLFMLGQIGAVDGSASLGP